MKNRILEMFVILSEAKDLLSSRPPGKQVLRFAQDDNSIWLHGTIWLVVS